jgi:hypothetical protein
VFGIRVMACPSQKEKPIAKLVRWLSVLQMAVSTSVAQNASRNPNCSIRG